MFGWYPSFGNSEKFIWSWNEKSDVTKITPFDFIKHRLPFVQINLGSEFGLSRFVDQNSDGVNLLIFIWDWKVTERSLEKAIALAGDTAEPVQSR